MSISMFGKNISPAEKFPALCGKGCTVFHTNQVTPVHFDVTPVNSHATSVNSAVTTVNSLATSVNSVVTPVNSHVTSVNFVVTPVNSFVTSVNSVVTPVHFDVTPVNSDVTCIHFDVTRINLDVRRKNLYARRINPRAVCIYRDVVYGKPNAPALIYLKIFSTNKAAVDSHVSTANTNKACMMCIKACVEPCKSAAEINH